MVAVLLEDGQYLPTAVVDFVQEAEIPLLI
jgi:hypothetical protein